MIPFRAWFSQSRLSFQSLEVKKLDQMNSQQRRYLCRKGYKELAADYFFQLCSLYSFSIINCLLCLTNRGCFSTYSQNSIYSVILLTMQAWHGRNFKKIQAFFHFINSTAANVKLYKKFLECFTSQLKCQHVFLNVPSITQEIRQSVYSQIDMTCV